MMKYRTQADLQAFSSALNEIGAHGKKMVALMEAANTTMLSNPLSESAPTLGLAAMKVGLTELEAIGTVFEKHAVRLLGEARRSDELVSDYVGRINGLDCLATMKRNGLMLMPW